MNLALLTTALLVTTPAEVVRGERAMAAAYGRGDFEEFARWLHSDFRLILPKIGTVRRVRHLAEIARYRATMDRFHMDVVLGDWRPDSPKAGHLVVTERVRYQHLSMGRPAVGEYRVRYVHYWTRTASGWRLLKAIPAEKKEIIGTMRFKPGGGGE